MSIRNLPGRIYGMICRIEETMLWRNTQPGPQPREVGQNDCNSKSPFGSYRSVSRQNVLLPQNSHTRRKVLLAKASNRLQYPAFDAPDRSMNYPEAIQLLYDLRWFGLKLGLENTLKLAALAGNPQDHLRFIHVAGTNGKGSTCAMLESMYRASGMRVGLFTSAHLVSCRERIQVNRQWISERDVVQLVNELQALVAAGFQPAVEPGVPPGGTPLPRSEILAGS